MKCIGRTNLFARCKNSTKSFWPFCPKHKYQLLKLFLGAIFTIIVFILSRYVYDKYFNPTIEEKCPKEIHFKSNEENQFKIVIFDFLKYTGDNHDIERKIENLIQNLNRISHIPIATELINCKSSEYGIYNLTDAKQFCKSQNFDLVIFGEFEDVGSSNNFQIQYASNPVIKSVNERENYSIDLRVESLINLNLRDNDIRLLKDIILWNLGGIAGEDKTKEGDQILNRYLNQISKEYDSLYYTSNIISGLIYRDDTEYEKSIEKFDKAIDFKPNWASAYYEKSITELKSSELELAAEDFKLFKIFNSECTEQQERLIYFSSYEQYDDQISPQTYAEHFPCEFDSTFIMKHQEYGYCLLLQAISSDKQLKKYFDSVYRTWKNKYPNSIYKPIVLK